MQSLGKKKYNSGKVQARVELRLTRNPGPASKPSSSLLKKSAATVTESSGPKLPQRVRLPDATSPLLDPQEEADPNCIEFDLLEEATHRVYFGFFNLDWLDPEDALTDQRTGLNRTYEETESQYNVNQSIHDRLSGHRSMQNINSAFLNNRYLDTSTDRHSGYHRSRGNRTLAADHSFMTTEFPHVCSLYHQPNTDSYLGYTSRFQLSKTHLQATTTGTTSGSTPS